MHSAESIFYPIRSAALFENDEDEVVVASGKSKGKIGINNAVDYLSVINTERIELVVVGELFVEPGRQVLRPSHQ